MKDRQLLLSAIAFALSSTAAEAPNFAGEYADKKFLKGQAVFQMSLEQSGNTVSVWFSAGYTDGHGAGPDADGSGKVTPKGTVEFKFEDSFKNAGTGTISRAGDDVIVSIKATRVADPRCLVFYKQSMRLPRVKQKINVGGALVPRLFLSQATKARVL
jgi:hypothetical protein